jgi:hypothetical protein
LRRALSRYRGRKEARMKTISLCAATVGLLLAARPAAAISLAETEAIYNQWLADYAAHQPDAAIAMTSEDFVMVDNQTVFNRAEAQAFVEQLAQFILSRQCTNFVIIGQALPLKSELLLSRVDCQFQTVIGPLSAHFYETIIVDKKGTIVYDHFTDIANPSL